MFPGFPERIQQELSILKPEIKSKEIKIRAISIENIWLSGSFLSVDKRFMSSWQVQQ